jgi:uncharacterized membrane protein HdeD (DUF308 family)
MSTGFPYFLAPNSGELDSMRGKWLWAVVLGGLLIVGGLLAIFFPVATTVVTATFFGVILLIAGVLQVASAFWASGWSGFFVHLLGGLLAIFVGVIFVDRPLISAVEWTLVLAIFCVAGGLIRIVSALALRFSAWGWSLFNGIVTLLLGVLIWRRWPGDGLWVIGTLVGIELLLSGWSWVMLGMALRTVASRAVAKGF